MATYVRADNPYIHFDIDPDSNSYLDSNGVLHGHVEPDHYSEYDLDGGADGYSYRTSILDGNIGFEYYTDVHPCTPDTVAYLLHRTSGRRVRDDSPGDGVGF